VIRIDAPLNAVGGRKIIVRQAVRSLSPLFVRRLLPRNSLGSLPDGFSLRHRRIKIGQTRVSNHLSGSIAGRTVVRHDSFCHRVSRSAAADAKTALAAAFCD